MENEKPAFFKLSVNKTNGESYEFVADRDNTELYRHVGALGLSMYDHAYIDLSDENGPKSTRIWRHMESYTQVEGYMIQNDFVVHDNLRRVNQSDIEAFDEMIMRQAGSIDEVPEGWSDEAK